ncbi:LptF/LptG family permease [Candidatus Pelagibacter sp.]|nr:LptF/LptG family permease [Candidatus Pelagibacter sp.]
MKLKTYQKYLITQFGKKNFQVCMVFFCLIFILNIFDEISFLKNTDANFLYPLLLTLLNSPSVLFEVFPFIFLISTQFFFLKVLDLNELNIYKNFGLSNFRILYTISIFSLFLGFFITLIFYNFSSKLKFTYLELKNSYSNDNKYLAFVNENGLWIKDEIDDKINIINALKIEDNFLIDVSITQFNKNFELFQNFDAKKINIKDNLWKMTDVINAKDMSRSIKIEYAELNTNFNIEKISNLFSNLSSLTIFELYKLKKDYKELGYSSVEISVHLQKIITFPFYLMAMTVFSAIIMLNINYNKPKIFHLIVGIMLSVIVYYISFFSNVLAENEKIPTLIASWMPLVILLLISSIGLVKINEK